MKPFQTRTMDEFYDPFLAACPPGERRQELEEHLVGWFAKNTHRRSVLDAVYRRVFDGRPGVDTQRQPCSRRSLRAAAFEERLAAMMDRGHTPERLVKLIVEMKASKRAYLVYRAFWAEREHEQRAKNGTQFF